MDCNLISSDLCSVWQFHIFYITMHDVLAVIVFSVSSYYKVAMEWLRARPAVIVQTWSRGCIWQLYNRKKHWTRWQQERHAWLCRRYGTVRHYTSHWRSNCSPCHISDTIHKSLEITNALIAVHVTSQILYTSHWRSLMQSMSHLFLARCMYVLHFATAHVPILTY